MHAIRRRLIILVCDNNGINVRLRLRQVLKRNLHHFRRDGLRGWNGRGGVGQVHGLHCSINGTGSNRCGINCLRRRNYDVPIGIIGAEGEPACLDLGEAGQLQLVRDGLDDLGLDRVVHGLTEVSHAHWNQTQNADEGKPDKRQRNSNFDQAEAVLRLGRTSRT
jgi:hypothetical protein